MYMSEIIGKLSSQFSLHERNLGEFAKVKKSGMNFDIRGWEIEGIGRMSALSMNAMLGLMKMETLVITPLEVDAPLYSFDFVRAMGNDTLIIELYDTQINPCELDGLDAVKAASAVLPDNDLGEHWYDYLHLSPTVSKKGKKGKIDLDAMVSGYTDEFIKFLKASPACEKAAKQAKVFDYTDTLLKKGGPACDQFKKMIGVDKTRELFMKFIFSAED